MNSIFIKIPIWVQWIFPQRIWSFKKIPDTVYLTFDDGPIPSVTPWVLSELKKHNAKATFFCVGDNIAKNQSILESIISEGHAIGNHTYNHLNGWKTETTEYIKNIQKTQQLVNDIDPLQKGPLFRPPFGKLTSTQSRELQKLGYKIIMWDVLSQDFDPNISNETCLQNVIKNIKVGSIIVFHDSLKSEKKLRYILPRVLEFVDSKGWKCDEIVLN